MRLVGPLARACDASSQKRKRLTTLELIQIAHPETLGSVKLYRERVSQSNVHPRRLSAGLIRETQAVDQRIHVVSVTRGETKYFRENPMKGPCA